MEFKKEILTNENLVVHCPEKWQAKKLLDWTHRNGKKWVTGVSYIDKNNWNEEKADTCYCIACGQYQNKEYYKAEGYKILSFEEAKENKMKFGDPVLVSDYKEEGWSESGKYRYCFDKREVISRYSGEYPIVAINAECDVYSFRYCKPDTRNEQKEKLLSELAKLEESASEIKRQIEGLE